MKLMWGPYSTVQHKLARSVLSPLITPLSLYDLPEIAARTCEHVTIWRQRDIAWRMRDSAARVLVTFYTLASYVFYLLATTIYIYSFCTTSGLWTLRVVSRIHKKLSSVSFLLVVIFLFFICIGNYSNLDMHLYYLATFSVNSISQLLSTHL